jgi:peptidoglycan/xylan/chitin deacetylase (PgdA/CDA1 family)
MPRISWKVRLSCCLLALVAGGSLGGSVEVRPAPIAIAPITIRPSPIREPRHDEPGPDVPALVPIINDDVTGLRFPSGLTIYGGTRRRSILFTFDDGPSRRTTPELLDILDDLDIKAVFFVKTESFGNGNPWEREHAAIVREIVRRGHLVGNHTETHRQLPLLSNAEIDAELAVSERKIEWTLGRTPRLIRPPGGALSQRVGQILAEHGYSSVMWALYAGDLEVETADDVVRTFFRVLDRRELDTGDRGGIVLMHDTRRHSVEALPRLVEALRRRNCKLLAKDEELYDIVDDLGYFIPGYEPDQTLDERQVEIRARARRSCHTVAFR